MRFVIDARPALDPRRTGVGHYVDRQLHHLPLVGPDDAYVAWYLHAKGLFRSRTFFDDVEASNLSEEASRFPARVFEPVSSRLSFPRVERLAGRFDALLATNFLPPATGSRAVVLVVHDLAFRVLPETAPHHDARWDRRFRRWLKRAARVIVPSEAAKADLVAFEDVDPAKVVAVHHGVDRWIPPPPADVGDTRRRMDLEGPFALFVGGIEPRKNLEALVEAFARVRTDAKLVVAGGRVNWFPEASEALEAKVAALPAAVRDRIVLTGYLPEADKRALLAGATALVYPSRYEGFGFPVLEGMAAGVPVLTSTVSSLPEVAGETAVLVDPNEVDAIADGIARLLGDEGLRATLAEAGRARAATFTWEASARATAEVLRAAAAVGPE